MIIWDIQIKNWKSEAIKDEQLTYHEDKGENSEQAKEINNMIVSSLLNISLCELKSNKFAEVRTACNEVLIRDHRNIKGL